MELMKILMDEGFDFNDEEKNLNQNLLEIVS